MEDQGTPKAVVTMRASWREYSLPDAPYVSAQEPVKAWTVGWQTPWGVMDNLEEAVARVMAADFSPEVVVPVVVAQTEHGYRVAPVLYEVQDAKSGADVNLIAAASDSQTHYWEVA